MEDVCRTIAVKAIEEGKLGGLANHYYCIGFGSDWSIRICIYSELQL